MRKYILNSKMQYWGPHCLSPASLLHCWEFNCRFCDSSQNVGEGDSGGRSRERQGEDGERRRVTFCQQVLSAAEPRGQVAVVSPAGLVWGFGHPARSCRALHGLPGPGSSRLGTMWPKPRPTPVEGPPRSAIEAEAWCSSQLSNSLPGTWTGA